MSFTSIGNNETVNLGAYGIKFVQIRAYTENVEVPSDDILKEPFIDTTLSVPKMFDLL